MVGCAQADVVSGNPNAHFNSSWGTRSIARPAWAVGWKCEFSIVAPQPFQRGPADRSGNGDGPAQRPIVAPATVPRILRPVRNSATARRSAPVNGNPWYRIDPDVSASTIACGDRPRSASRAGARASPASWQLLHEASNSAAPSGREDGGRAAREIIAIITIAL